MLQLRVASILRNKAALQEAASNTNSLGVSDNAVRKHLSRVV